MVRGRPAFLPDFWLANFSWLVPASWSLAAELTINLPFALFHRWLNNRTLIVVVAVSFIGLAPMTFMQGSIDAGSMGSNWFGGVLRVAFAFPLGVLLYRNRTRLSGWAPVWATWPSMALLLVLLSLPAPAPIVPFRDLAIAAIGLPALLIFAANARPGVATAGIASALGDLSYPIYVLHSALIGITGWLLLGLTGHPLEAATSWQVALVLFAIVAICLLLDQYADRPLRSALSVRQPRTTPSHRQPFSTHSDRQPSLVQKSNKTLD
ncbi:MAG: acyltransferase [Devosia sp.]